MAEATVDNRPKCEECGFALESAEHIRGVGLHGHISTSSAEARKQRRYALSGAPGVVPGGAAAPVVLAPDELDADDADEADTEGSAAIDDGDQGD